MNTKQITLAVYDIDERAKEVILHAGGAVTSASYIYLVTLPKGTDHTTTYTGRADIEFWTDDDTKQVILALEQDIDVTETKLNFIEEVDYSDDEAITE